MDDMTKDLIPRKAVEYRLRKQTVSTNPEAYKAHKKFIGYMDDPEISQFGYWMHANGYNCALVSVAVDLDKIPSTQPEREKGHWIYYNNGIEEYYECSACGNAFVLIEGSPKDNNYNFCPNCGARMDGKDGDLP